MSRLAKQLFIAAIFLGIALLIAWPVYRLVVPSATCTDGIQNQGEEGVDCGVVCGKSCPPVILPLKVMPATIVADASSSYDVLAELQNPNGAYGAKLVPYVLTVTDAAGKQLATRQGATYVNPAVPRYLVFPFSSFASVPSGAQLQIDPTTVQWGALQIDAAGAVSFAVRSELLTSGPTTTHYTAAVTNNSAFDFDTVDITVLLHDQSGAVVAAGTTVVRTLTAGQERGFVVDWPFVVAGAVRAEPIISTNIFDNQNFIRTHGVPQPFQGN